jgi:hypothetical protein
MTKDCTAFSAVACDAYAVTTLWLATGIDSAVDLRVGAGFYSSSP